MNIFKNRNSSLTINEGDEKIKENKKSKPLIEFIQTLTLAIVLSLCIFAFITPAEVEGSSMEPNFHNGERVYTNRLPQWLGDSAVGSLLHLKYDRGEVVVLSIPGTGISLIKRIIGLPGDKVEILNGQILVNDKHLVEDYLPKDLETFAGTFLKEGENKIIPENSYFVAGDNRSRSNDSRYFGFVKREWLQGKILARVWPLNKFGFIQQGQYELTNN